jgi:hypothetical protein
MSKIALTNTLIDCVSFDGASNVQKVVQFSEWLTAGSLLCFKVLNMWHLCFQRNLEAGSQYQIVCHRFMYRVCLSGSMHSPYALFQKHVRSFNDGRTIGLLHDSETHTEGHFMAMHCDLRLKGALHTTAAGSDSRTHPTLSMTCLNCIVCFPPSSHASSTYGLMIGWCWEQARL